MNHFYLVGGLPWWVILPIGLGMLALLIYQFLGLGRRLGARQAWLLISLRGGVYALLIFLLLSPGLVQHRMTKLRRPLVLLIDTSQSMGLPAHPGQSPEPRRAQSRLDLVKEKLLEGSEPWIRKLARDYDLRLYRFGTSLEPIPPESLSQLAARGEGTRLWEALREAGREAGAQAGILLFSDGIANGERATGERIAYPGPLFAVGVGEAQGFTDLRIADLRAPEFAFRGREVKLDFVIQAYGLKGKGVPLYFNRGRNLISTRSITIDRDPFEQRITLTYIPKEIGPHSFTLSVPLQAGEQIAQNNQREFRIHVQRDKIRILTLSGTPSWNYRFLRMALKQDPFIDLVSFVFLRTPTDSVDVPDSQLSLIPFPVDEIFLEELNNFDLIFLDDFSFRSYFNVLYLEKVRDFVRRGGGLAMLGGVRSFDSGGYGESPLREVLPVELSGKGVYQTSTRVRPLLTSAGKAHPITRLLPDPRANEEAWEKMPALTAFNQVLRARGETLLLAGAGGGYPLLTVGKFGKGRTLALMSDDFWRWNFTAVGERESPQNHLKLMRQAVRWLAQEPSFEQVQIISMGGSRAPGEKMNFKVRVLKDDFTPTAHASVRLWAVGPDGERISLESAPDTEEGEYGAEFIPAREGSYQIEAEADLAGKPLGKDRKSFLVAFPYGEREDGRPRPELLRQIAEMSQGEFLSISQWDEKTPERIRAKLERFSPSEIIERQQIPLWSTFWTFLPILLLLSGEWWLRRRWGLI